MYVSMEQLHKHMHVLYWAPSPGRPGHLLQRPGKPIGTSNPSYSFQAAWNGLGSQGKHSCSSQLQCCKPPLQRSSWPKRWITIHISQEHGRRLLSVNKECNGNNQWVSFCSLHRSRCLHWDHCNCCSWIQLLPYKSIYSRSTKHGREGRKHLLTSTDERLRDEVKCLNAHRNLRGRLRGWARLGSTEDKGWSVLTAHGVFWHCNPRIASGRDLPVCVNAKHQEQRVPLPWLTLRKDKCNQEQVQLRAKE